jgi:glycosyltransferase involved in cell wall biosynthesis
LYAHKIKVNSRRADLLLSISSHTKQDFVKILGVEDSKIAVTPLGVTQPGKSVKAEVPNYRYVESTWGYLKQPYELPNATPFLLFVGGADRRRSLSDLVAAFNNLRAEGHDLKLVLSGDIMQGPLNIPTPETQYALTNSSYLDDIIFMGFTEDSVRDWLYKNCLAFVYPSRYEGFGLPVLEAMVYGSPVICYENGALKEIGGEAPLYANDSETLRQRILELLSASNKQLLVMRANGEAQAAKFSWTKTAKDMLSHLSQLDG